ncbi:MAG: ATP-binding cassette domain-containing protein [Bacteroidia bacterium]|nr:ATP-binding cassette domain-containing protein [Bacteroidia bacterium]
MLLVDNVTLQFGGRVLFKNVHLTFDKGNCYGIIGANGTGKSTFLQILTGELEPNKGEVVITDKERISSLKQDHHAYDGFRVVDAVLEGHQRLMRVQKERDALYAKSDFSDSDGLKAAELEQEYAELNGYEADSEARTLLNSLGIANEYHDMLVGDLDQRQIVKVLLAQALFGNPDILILDEPTNDLDIQATRWLENFLYNFDNIVIIVSHDRHFLNKVCTRILDVDYGKITSYVGNYDFWYQSSQLVLEQSKRENVKKETRIKELETFIARFSANASKSKQATSRKKELEKINLDDLKPSSRRYPFVEWKFEKEVGNNVLEVKNLTKNGIFKNISFLINRGDKVAFIADNSQVLTALFDILGGVSQPDGGEFRYGVTITPTYFPSDNTSFFAGHDENLVEWIRPYSKDQSETTLRGWLGRMLFAGDEALKPVNVLSGGERVRLMLARMMLIAGNLLILDDPTNHLDLEAITALNKGMINYRGVVLFTSHDRELIETSANRIIYIKEKVVYDKYATYEEFLELFNV